MTAPDALAALEAAAVVAMAGDQFDRFVASLSPFLRESVRETERLRAELSHHTACALTASLPREALEHAQWVAKHVVEIAYRWGALRNAYMQWAARDCPPVVVALTGGGR